MYLSRLFLNARSRQVQKELSDPYQLHRTIMAAFPATLPPDERVLHRLDIDLQTGQLLLLVQSQTRPNWANLAEGEYLLPAILFADWENPAVKEVELTFKTEQRLCFRLRANPTKRLFRDRPEYKLKKGQRIGLLKEEEQQAWLQKQGSQGGGFYVLDATVRNDGFTSGWTKKRHKLKHFAVCFDGILEVTHPEQFQEILINGIGSGKAFGFGLLSVAPVR